MDLALSEEQQLLKDTARRFFEKEYPKTLVREQIGSPHAYSPALWQHLAELGWLGLPFPEQYGGCAGSFLDLAILLEETGRALLMEPFFSTTLLGAYPILDAGTEAQKTALLPRIASGELVATLAWLETGAAYDPGDITLGARFDGESFVLDGVKLFVPNAEVSDIILTLARTGDGDDRHGITIFMVDRHAPGLHCTPLKPLDGSKLYEVAYSGVRVKREEVLGEIGGGWRTVDHALARAAVGECLQMLGGAQVALEMSVEHVRNRVQFGQSVGAFQAVQHHCANMATDLDGARFLTYQAAWMLSEGLPCAKEVAMAKAWVSDACHRVISRAHQVHGGVGFIGEHDLTLFFRRIKSGELAYGGSNFHYRALAQALGL